MSAGPGRYPPHMEQEQHEDRAPDQGSTGVPAVDAVIASLEGLQALPLRDQVVAYEQTHDRLRSALDAPDEAVPAVTVPGALHNSAGG